MAKTQELLEIVIDGQKVSVPPETTIFDAAAKLNIEIPILCHREHMNPVAVCRVCCIDAGESRLVPACYRKVKDVWPNKAGVREIKTHHQSEKVKTAVSCLTEMLVGDHVAGEGIPPDRITEANELVRLKDLLNIQTSRFPGRIVDGKPFDRGQDDSSVVIGVDHNLCILCDRCIRGCNDIRDNQVLARRGKGYTAGIAFDLHTPMGDSSCVSCGECMISCPTGALSFKHPVFTQGQVESHKKQKKVDWKGTPWEGVKPEPQMVTAEELSQHKLFKGVAQAFLRWNEGSVVRRTYKKGDVICREREYGSTAFFIEKGNVEILIESPLKHVKSRKGKGAQTGWGPFGLFQRFTTGLVSRAEDQREDESATQYIHIDAPVSLTYSNPVAQIGPGQIFGEMSCMSNYPRSATVRATEDVVVLEMLRNVLYILQRNKASKAILDEAYKAHAVENHLRSVAIFSQSFADEKEFQQFVNDLRSKVELERCNPGDVIFRQGDPADDFFLVRVGFVKVSQKQLGGERVLNYIGPGGYFGEIGLMSDISEIREMVPAGVRTATCSSLDHADLVRIKGDDFRALLTRYPKMRAKFVKIALEHLQQNEQAQKNVEQYSLGEYLRQGLFEAQSLLVLDLEKCTRCDECTKACADAHDGVTRLIREGLRFDRFLVASSCRSCLDPYCMVGCPVGSIRRVDGKEILIEDWCIGCGKCAENCPYGNINMHGFEEIDLTTRTTKIDPTTRKPIIQQKATTCDLCRDLDGQPSCVYACPHDAAHRMRGSELLQIVELDSRR